MIYRAFRCIEEILCDCKCVRHPHRAGAGSCVSESSPLDIDSLPVKFSRKLIQIQPMIQEVISKEEF